MTELGDALKQARQAQGLTLEGVAVAIGSSFTTIWRYEAGQRVPSGPALFALATLYDTTVEHLVAGRIEPAPVETSSPGAPSDQDQRIITSSARDAALKAFGARLQRARLAAGLSQEDVASALGVAIQSIRNWEVGRAEPRRVHKDQLARLFGVAVEELIFGPSGGSDSSSYDEDMEFLKALPQLNYRGVRETLTPADARVIRGVVLRLQELGVIATKYPWKP